MRLNGSRKTPPYNPLVMDPRTPEMWISMISPKFNRILTICIYTYTPIIQDIMYSLIFLRRKNAIHFAMAPVVRTEIFFSWRMVLFDLPIRDSPTNAITYGCPFQSI